MNKPIRIIGTGKFLPEALSSAELEMKFGLPTGWSEKYSGVKNRHIVTNECNGEMGSIAADRALDSAGLKLGSIDMIISASSTYDYPLPNQGAVIKSKMKDGEKFDVPALDIDYTCLSFVSAFDLAVKMLDGESYKRILIVSSEMSSKGINKENWETLTLFGDGAAAVVLEYDALSDSKFVKGTFQTYSSGVYDTIIEGGGNKNFFSDHPYDSEMHSFKMNGKKLLRLAMEKIPQFMNKFFKSLPIEIIDVDVIIPHQASKTGLEVFKKMYTFSKSQVIETLENYGNCIAASVPLTLIDAIDSGKLKRGDSCLLTGTAAGFSIGAILIEY